MLARLILRYGHVRPDSALKVASPTWRGQRPPPLIPCDEPGVAGSCDCGSRPPLRMVKDRFHRRRKSPLVDAIDLADIFSDIREKSPPIRRQVVCSAFCAQMLEPIATASVIPSRRGLGGMPTGVAATGRRAELMGVAPREWALIFAPNSTAALVLPCTGRRTMPLNQLGEAMRDAVRFVVDQDAQFAVKFSTSEKLAPPISLEGCKLAPAPIMESMPSRLRCR